MAEFDAISKHLIQTYPHEFAGLTLERDDVEVLEIIDTEQTTVTAHQTDSLIRVRINGQQALVHNEFQTTDSTRPPMPGAAIRVSICNRILVIGCLCNTK